MPNIYRANIPEDENRGENAPPQNNKSPKKKNNKNKTDFKTMKKNTVKSLNDVEYFLNNFGHIIKCVKICKYFKK